MSNTNLRLWELVEKTNPEYTKKFNVNGYSGTAISGTYANMRATELFGPCGTGWGYEIVQERYDEGMPFIFNEIPMIEKTHTIHLRLWYKEESKSEKVFIDGFGHTPYMYLKSDKTRVIVDSEAPKKTLTDAIKKCLSMIGVGADIYMGMHDDSYYVEELKNESAMTNAEDKIDEKARQAIEYREWLESNLNLIKTATSLHELSVLYKGAIRKLELRKDERSKVAFTRTMEERKTELEKSV